VSGSYNSVPPLIGGSTRDALEALGITQFPSATEWYQVIGGIIVQGGRVAVADGATVTVNLVAPYEKQVLGTWTQVSGSAGNDAYVTSVGLTSFQIVNGSGARTYYWLSLGV
jgi:hypothetical protein